MLVRPTLAQITHHWYERSVGLHTKVEPALGLLEICKTMIKKLFNLIFFYENPVRLHAFLSFSSMVAAKSKFPKTKFKVKVWHYCRALSKVVTVRRQSCVWNCFFPDPVLKFWEKKLDKILRFQYINFQAALLPRNSKGSNQMCNFKLCLWELM